jgi:hypothetical protein
LHVFQTERAREKFFLFANRVDIAKIESSCAMCLRSTCVSQDTLSSFIFSDQMLTAAISALYRGEFIAKCADVAQRVAVMLVATDSAACGVAGRYSFCEMPA